MLGNNIVVAVRGTQRVSFPSSIQSSLTSLLPNHINPTEFCFGKHYVLYDATVAPAFDPALFDLTTLVERGLLQGEISGGRGRVSVFSLDGKAMVLRHYHRGGAIRHLVQDSYLWTGRQRSRAWAEWRLLAQLQTLGLPALKPLAARAVRRGLFYRADLVTHLIEGVEPLAVKICRGPIGDSLWRKIGTVLRQFHLAGVYHPDLNANNILLNQQDEVFLVDFDKAQIRPSDNGSWKRKNMARLRRGLDKMANERVPFFFSETDWSALTEAYKS